MATRDAEAYLELARSVADGDPVNWHERASAASSERDRRLIQALGLLAEVGRMSSISMREASEAGELRVAVGDVARPAPPLAGRWGALRLVERIGTGAFGDVYRALDPDLDRTVALKVLRPHRDPSLDQRLLAEGRSLARLRHPNVVHVYGVARHQDRVGIWMEHLTGRTLADLVREHGPLSEREAALVGLDLCRALAAVHGSGVLHRDVKAQNVMREAGGRIVLMDLGAGLTVDAGAAAATPDAPAGIQGTPAYLAPEVLDGDPPSAQSDLYALGVLLYHLVTGHYPVGGRSVDELRTAHAAGERVALGDARPELSAPFLRVVERALEPHPMRRFGSAGDMGRALGEVMGERFTESAEAVTPPSRATTATGVELHRIEGEAGRVPGRRDGKPVDWHESRFRIPRRLLGPIAALLGLAVFVPTYLEWRAANAAVEVEASLLRLDAGAPEVLAPGAAVAPGDLLALSVETDRPVHVYVVNADADGRSYLLFPLAGSDLRNPLPPDSVHLVPGSRDGRQSYWQVTSAGRREELVVIASPEPLAEMEALVATLPPAEPGRTPLYPHVSGAAARRLRGIGGVVTPEPAPAGADSAPGLLPGVPERTGGVWVRRFTLANPSR